MTPKYTIRHQSIHLTCETDRAKACAHLIQVKCKGGVRNSDFWGTAEFAGRKDGTVVVTLPFNLWNARMMLECGAEPDMGDRMTAVRIGKLRDRGIETTVKPKAGFELRPFQIEGCNHLLKRDLNTILSFDVGLGKTVTALATMWSDPDRYFPCVVLAPAHVKLNWQDEWIKWKGDPDRVTVLFGRTPDAEQLHNKDLIVLNHHILAGWQKELKLLSPNTLLIDEAHNFVNRRTKTYPLAEDVSHKHSGRCLMLTATPLVNDLGNLWCLTNLINPDILGGIVNFQNTFMPEEEAKKKLLSKRWRGGQSKMEWKHVAMARLPKAVMERRIKELSSILHGNGIILRKRKAEVLDQLPKIIDTDVRIDIDTSSKEGKEFWERESHYARMLKESKEDSLASNLIYSTMNSIRQDAIKAKQPYAEEWIRDFLDGTDSKEKLIVVGWSVDALETLHKKFKSESLLINGTISANKKHERAHQFGTDPEKRVLFGNIKSIGTGIDLVAASNMLIIEIPMTAVDLEQVRGRIDRLSQVSNVLMYYTMTIRDSLEEKIGWGIIRRKQKLTEDLGL